MQTASAFDNQPTTSLYNHPRLRSLLIFIVFLLLHVLVLGRVEHRLHKLQQKRCAGCVEIRASCPGKSGLVTIGSLIGEARECGYCPKRSSLERRSKSESAKPPPEGKRQNERRSRRKRPKKKTHGRGS
uniref:Uncharacterized protein n=1 Tax=Candidatus Kentrum sp. FM TaxID=2126340 RepID=A0A450SEK6_9GAMM|nr:MAG: hypothetical protein BECKFM1743A_GA0114220_100916 [Candidatus Kentron sp. FM]VFJ51262.1 MAG: hypothetical protein BECKFM1743C_GA0114222_100956 [Candidatus Kentron sp. FM]VFK08870.1 MAG: hypothetical protein BECKFM1743B_GA0114221_100845 [Candidatus Kentron sp. FM]